MWGMDAHYKREGDDVKRKGKRKELKVGKRNYILNRESEKGTAPKAMRKCDVQISGEGGCRQRTR